MKNKLSSLLPAARCQHRTSTGRQCASLSANKASGLCARHASIKQAEADVSAPLIQQACRFQNAQGINHSLSALYTLLAQDRVSPRRASVLAYISSLLLRSLDAIDNDRYPNAGVPTPFPIAAASAPVSSQSASSSALHSSSKSTPDSGSSTGESQSAPDAVSGSASPVEPGTPLSSPEPVSESGPASRIGPGIEPLPATARQFVEEVLKREPN